MKRLTKKQLNAQIHASHEAAQTYKVEAAIITLVAYGLIIAAAFTTPYLCVLALIALYAAWYYRSKETNEQYHLDELFTELDKLNGQK